MYLFKVSFKSFRYILMPFCHGGRADGGNEAWTSGEHWMMLVANTQDQTVGFVNSKPQDNTYNATGMDCIKRGR